MRTPIDIRRKRDARKPCKRDHSECCEYVQCIVWTKELPPFLQRGRTDVQQIR